MKFEKYFRAFIGWLMVIISLPIMPLLLDIDLFLGFTIPIIMAIIGFALADIKENEND